MTTSTAAPASASWREEIEHALGGDLVELAGRLVGQDDRRVVGQRDRQPGARELAARELGGARAGAVGDRAALEHVAADAARRPPASRWAMATLSATDRCADEVVLLVEQPDVA